VGVGVAAKHLLMHRMVPTTENTPAPNENTASPMKIAKIYKELNV
jgi:hypothetical protein